MTTSQPHRPVQEAVTGKSLAAQQMIERAVGVLLPHAGRGLALNAPLRWHESYMQGGREPFSFALWVCLDPEKQRTIDVNRTLPADRDAGDRLWGCHVTEPTPQEEDEADQARYAAAGLSYPKGQSRRRVSVNVSRFGEVGVDVRRHRQKNPPKVGTCVGFEDDHDMSPERRQELLRHVGEMLTLAETQAPDDQRRFFAANRLNLAARSFTRLASPASKEALVPVLAANPAAP